MTMGARTAFSSGATASVLRTRRSALCRAAPPPTSPSGERGAAQHAQTRAIAKSNPCAYDDDVRRIVRQLGCAMCEQDEPRLTRTPIRATPFSALQDRAARVRWRCSRLPASSTAAVGLPFVAERVRVIALSTRCACAAAPPIC